MAALNTIPASDIVAVTPSVLSAGAAGLQLSGLMLTPNPRVPIGQVLSFPSALAVSNYFGPTSQEYTLALTYFLGFTNSQKKPGALLFAQYNTTSVGAYLRGGSLAGTTLTQLQAFSGNLSVTIDGTPHTVTGINLSAATSFSNAAIILSTALGTVGPAIGTFTGSIATTVLTVTVAPANPLTIGASITGSGVSAATTITAFLTGSGGTGTYTVSVSQTASSTAMTATSAPVTFDSLANAFVISSGTVGGTSTMSFGGLAVGNQLNLTQALGAVLSQGAAATTGTALMNSIINTTTNWASFMTINQVTANQILGLAAWVNGQNDEFWYVAWDTDVTPTESTAATASAGYMIQAAAYSGVTILNAPVNGAAMAAFAMGWAASLDFNQRGGRTTLAFRGQTGLLPDIDDITSAQNLRANGYNFYGVWGTAAANFIFANNGTVSGPFVWADSYINQIWLNSQLQLALMILLTQARAIPYNAAGYALIAASVGDVRAQAKNFGVFSAGVTLSSLQIEEVNQAAGIDIATALQNDGDFLLILPTDPSVRALRGSPPMTYFYVDGGSVQKIQLASVEVQ